MNKTINVLIIEDHPLIVDAYVESLNQITHICLGFQFEIDVAYNCDSAVLKIDNASKEQSHDLIFLDIKLPPSKDKKFLGGIDLGVLIREKLKDTKIMVSTMLDDCYMVSYILKKLNPESFLIKSDLTKDILIEAIKSTVLDPPYYSKSVIKIFRKQSATDVVIDDIDRKILHELSNGTKMKELPEVLPLSIAALERRKRILKNIFNAKGKGDRDLIQLAIEKGFV